MDSNIVTGISDKKLNKKVKPTNTYHLSTDNTFVEVMNYLESHNTGTDDDIYSIQTFLSVNPENKDFYSQLITKKFRLGCDKKVVNSVVPNLIPSWDVQQAYPISEKNEPKDGEWFALSQKLNGNNAAYYKGKMISRQGKEFSGLDHIIKDIERLPKHENYILCTGVEEGEGKYTGMLGLIHCDYKGFDLGVGSGFTDEQRRYYWNHPDEIIGKIVQIKFKGETTNKNGGVSVQFPIFEIVRTDKTEPSYN